MGVWLCCLILAVAQGKAATIQRDGTGSGTEAAIPAHLVGQTIIKAKLPHGERVIALTFDDGPHPEATAQILEILKANEVRATFFLIGKSAKAHPELVRAIARDQHAIGNHSWSHGRSLTKAQAEQEIAATQAAIREAGGRTPVLFRPPFGLRTSELARAAQRAGLTSILWSVSSADTRPIDVATITNNILHTPWPGDIVLFHDAGGDKLATVRALPGILAGLKQQGVRCVTVPELLALVRPPVPNSTASRKP